ncbi:MAG: divergent PAP2 family protein [Spirochaetia bacterium]
MSGLTNAEASRDTLSMLSHRAVDILAKALANPVFLSALSSWFVAQLLKSCIMLFRNRPQTAKEIILNLFWTTGGMPSSHSAVVAALATSAGFVAGPDSTLFIVTLFYAVLTFRDALGVRRSAGAQAKVLNQLIRDLSVHFSLRSRPVKEIHGHTMPEVFVGALLGFFIALAYCTL